MHILDILFNMQRFDINTLSIVKLDMAFTPAIEISVLLTQVHNHHLFKFIMFIFI